MKYLPVIYLRLHDSDVSAFEAVFSAVLAMPEKLLQVGRDVRLRRAVHAFKLVLHTSPHVFHGVGVDTSRWIDKVQ